MKLLFITTTYPTPVRLHQGAFNRHLVDALRATHDVRVIAPIPWGQCFSTCFLNRHFADDHPCFFYPPKVLRNHYDRFYWQSILPTLRRLEQTFVPDIVLGYWLHPDGAVAVRAAERFRVPCVVVSGGSDLRRLPNNANRRVVIEQTLQRIDRLVVVSHDLKSVAQSLGMPPNKTDVVYRGVDQHCFQTRNPAEARARCGIAPDAVVLLWSGRLESVKNPLMVLRAVAQWRKKWPGQLQLLIAGDGSMRVELLREQSFLGLKDCVRFEGNLSQDELALRYNAADVMLLTSRSEGIPNVLLEAIASGLSFVATDVGGVTEIATPGLDHLVPDGDVDALVRAVVQQIESPSTVPRRFVPDSLAAMAARYEDVFHRVLNIASVKKAS